MNTDWIGEGLRFHCTRCSHCCRHESGYVFLSESDIAALQDFLNIPREDFIDRYCTAVPFGFDHHVSLREQENCDCIFWVDGGCSVYEARPVQCRTYPFWSHLVESEKRWENEASSCPGIGVGPVVPARDIEERINTRRQNIPFRWRGKSE